MNLRESINQLEFVNENTYTLTASIQYCNRITTTDNNIFVQTVSVTGDGALLEFFSSTGSATVGFFLQPGATYIFNDIAESFYWYRWTVNVGGSASITVTRFKVLES